jgi:hypothetical protein
VAAVAVAIVLRALSLKRTCMHASEMCEERKEKEEREERGERRERKKG